MNGTPPPADLNKLKGILGNAKKIMQKGNDYETGNVDASSLAQNTSGYVNESPNAQPTMNTGQPQGHMGVDATRKMGQITSQAVANSNMPESIKQAMLESPIAQPTMNHTFNLDDVSDLVEKPMPVPQARPRAAAPRQMNENVIHNQPNDTFTVSESSLRGIIKDVLIEYLAGDYQKNITEGVIKKTITTLIKEGKVKTKK